MNIFLLILGAITIKGMQLAPADGFHKDYLAKDNTTWIKGLFTLLILLRHCLGYFAEFSPNDQMMVSVRGNLDQLIVVPFLLYSGFGIMESIRAKGSTYIRNLPKKRVFPLWIDFLFAVLMYFVLQTCIGTHYRKKTLLAALFAWNSIGNSSWYVFGILAEYMLVFFSFLPLMKGKFNEKKLALCTGLMTVLTMFLMYFLYSVGKDPSWYNTLIVFPLGMWFSLIKKPFDRMVMKSSLIYSTIVLLTAALLFWAYLLRDQSFSYYTLWVICFSVLILLAGMKIACKSGILEWFGSHVFSVYILQRLPMILLDKLGLVDSHPYISVTLIIISTVWLASFFDKYIPVLRKGILKFCRLT